MPHKNDIKFVKTARCNDRTAWLYGVGAKGVSQRRKENARASGERKGRTAGTNSKRNRNGEQPPSYCSWQQSIWFLRTRNKLGTVRRMWQYARKTSACFFRSLGQNVIESCFFPWECRNIKINLELYIMTRRVLFVDICSNYWRKDSA